MKEPTLPVGADDAAMEPTRDDPDRYKKNGRLKSAAYDAEIERLQEQLVLLQYWIHAYTTCEIPRLTCRNVV